MNLFLLEVISTGISNNIFIALSSQRNTLILLAIISLQQLKQDLICEWYSKIIVLSAFSNLRLPELASIIIVQNKNIV